MKREIKILIVEDDPFFAKLCRQCLEERGFFVILAIDGEEALEKFQKEKPDLVILDILLPKIDSYQVLRTIRVNPDQELAKTPVIVLTNLYREKEKERFKNLELDAYLIKASITGDDLIVKVKEVLEKMKS